MAGETIWLQRPTYDVPWGFRLSGGRDYQQPITVSRVTVGTIADAQLKTGDTINRISDFDTSYMTQAQANDAIKNAGNLLQLVVVKGGAVPYSPQPQKQFPTRLERQLSDIENHTFSPPVTPQYGYDDAPPAPPPPPGNPPTGPSYMRPFGGYQPPNPKPNQHFNRPQSPPQQQMPDAVANMAAKGPPGKKPFSYAPDVSCIQEQRDKVRKKQPVGNLPRYQNMLNLPNFEDDTPVRSGPTSAPVQQQQHQPAAPSLPAGAGEGTFVHAQFNSPLQLYSDDNVAKAFEGQTGGVVSGTKRGTGGGQSDKDITMSPTYRLLHGLDANKPRPKVHLPQPGGDPNMLAPEGVADYDETSIRYRGRNIPSKSFRMLQDMTGGPADTGMPDKAPPSARHIRQPNQPLSPDSPQQDPDDIVDIRFVGGNIPSRSFRMLQQSIGEPETPAYQSVPQSATNAQGRTVKVIKLRTQPQNHDASDACATDF